MIRSKLCTKTSFDLVRSCLCKRDGEAAARDVVKLLLTEPDPTGVRRTCRMSQLPLQPSLQHHIGLCHSPASESFIIFGCQGNSLLHQMGINMTPRPQNKQQQQHKSTLNNPTAVQLSIVLLRLREQLPSFFNGHHDFNLYSPNINFEYSVAKRSPLVIVGKQRYKAIVETFRHTARLIWAAPKLELIKITKVIDNGTIECRWRVSGQLRGRFGRGKERILYDAFSIFTVDLDGLICKHKLQKVMPHPSTVKVTSWWDHLLTRLTARTAD